MVQCKARVLAIFEGWCGFGMVGKALSPLAPLCKGELLLQCEALPTIEGLLTEVSEKRKGCGRKAITPVVARIFSGDSTSPLTREARIWCEAKALLLYQNDNERIYHAKKCINYAESSINRNPFLPPLEKGEVARLIQIFRLLYSIQIVLPLQF